ncbi:MAG: hypothetical protein ACFE8L_08780 [Candidatus Hodarchaeota archaeon]
MSVVPTIKKKGLSISKYLDWDKFKNQFYNNIYLDDYKIVIKIPLIHTEKSKDDIKIKRFNLEKYTFLLSYD